VTSHAAEMRLKELTDEVARRHLNNTVTHEFMDRVEKEAERLEVQIANYKKSKSMGSYAPPPRSTAAPTPTPATTPVHHSQASALE
jgi:hypothetical protein